MIRLIFIVFILVSSTILNATTLENKDWVKKENLTKPIILSINGENLDLDKDIDKIVTYYNSKPYDYFFLPSKEVINKREKECAINIKNNIYLLRPSRDKPIKLPHNLTWSENPFNDRNWQFWFHSLFFTDCLLDGYTLTKDIWYLNRTKWLVSDWWSDNFKKDFPSEKFSWYDHTIPKRLHEFMRIFEFIRRNNALDKEYTKIALRSIYWHARIISEEKSLYKENHNHGLDQSKVLFEVSQLFSEFPLSSQWESIAKKRLKNEITFALTSEGIHTENSPGYHGWVSSYCATINHFSKHYTGSSITNNYIKLQEGGLKFLSTITKPDNTLAQLGDTSANTNLHADFPDLENLAWYPYYLYIISNGKNGTKPSETTTIFPESGYFIYRDKWDNPGENSAMHLVMKCGFLAKGHRHIDDGNILLYGLGEDWLIDAGMYGYEHNAYRDYILSPSAHNISFPYNTKLSHPAYSMDITSVEERFTTYKDNWGIVESNITNTMCESHMFKGYTYKRGLEITGKRSFKLSDRLFTDNNDNNNTYMTLFKVPDDKDIYINTEKKIILVLNSTKDATLEIRYFNNFSEIKLFRGEKSDIVSLETVGWLKMQPAKTITFIDINTSYLADFELQLISSVPLLKGFKKMSICYDKPTKINKTEVNIQDSREKIIFNTIPIRKKANLKVSFYLYKDGVKIDRQKYSKNFIYTLNKKKFGSGKYRIKYFIIENKVNNPSKKIEKEIGYSKYIIID